MSAWRIRAYYLEGGACPIKNWYRVQEKPVQAAFDAVLDTLKATVDWEDTKAFKVLKRGHSGLGEIRFRIDKPKIRRFRPVGIWPPIVPGEFILLLGCEKERDGKLIPRDAFTLALDYKRRYETGEGEIYDYF